MTNSLILIAAVVQVLGALIGTGTTTFAEIFYIKAAADGKIDQHEKHYLRRMFRGIHVGMTLVVLAGIALIVLEYLVPDATQNVMASAFWAIQSLVFFILILAYLVAKEKVTWWFSSAAIFTAWWLMLILDVGYLYSYSYITLMILYVLSTFVVAGVLGYIRVLAKSLYTKKSS